MVVYTQIMDTACSENFCFGINGGLIIIPIVSFTQVIYIDKTVIVNVAYIYWTNIPCWLINYSVR